MSKRGLARVLFVVGHAAVKQLVFIEQVASDLKKEKKPAEDEAPPADDGAPGRCRPPARRGPLRADARHGRPSTLCTIVNQLQIIPTILNRHQLQINGRTTKQIK